MTNNAGVNSYFILYYYKKENLIRIYRMWG